MKKNLILAALVASATLSSCSKSDKDDSGTPTPSTPPPSTTPTLDATEKLLVGKWVVDKQVDSSTVIQDGKMDPSSPFVFNLTATGRYLELKDTRLNMMVGTDVKHKDAVDALYNVGMDQYWMYEASTKILHVTNDHEVLDLSSDKLVIRYVTANSTSGTTYRYRCITSYLHRE